MATIPRNVYDQDGNLVESGTVDVDDSTVNGDNLRDKARQALTSNATFLANASPTNAQNAAQVKSLTRQVNALIKLILNDLNDTAGT